MLKLERTSVMNLENAMRGAAFLFVFLRTGGADGAGY